MVGVAGLGRDDRGTPEDKLTCHSLTSLTDWTLAKNRSSESGAMIWPIQKGCQAGCETREVGGQAGLDPAVRLLAGPNLSSPLRLVRELDFHCRPLQSAE